MGFLATIRTNSRLISDHCAGTSDYFELATTNLSLYRALHRAARAHLRGRVLDAGCGRMAYRKMLEECCERYESLDVSDAVGGTDHVADLQQTKLPDAQYDGVFCTQVLQHLPEPQRAVNEIARMLRPGGRAVFSVPHLVWLHNEPHDYLRFTNHVMRFMLARAGLRVVSIEPVGGLICFLAYAPSTFALALLRPVRPLFALGLLGNKLFIRLALLLDRMLGCKSLYPTNFVAIAVKPE